MGQSYISEYVADNYLVIPQMINDMRYAYTYNVRLLSKYSYINASPNHLL